MKRLIIVGIMLTFLSGLFGCRDEGERVHVRFRNNSSKDITNLWLGAGSGDGGKNSRTYGAIASGDTTDYKSVEPSYGSYGDFNFVTADRKTYRVSIFPNEDIGRLELKPGYYTYALTITGDQANLHIINEPAPTR